MKLASILQPDAICPELGATDKMGVLREMTHQLSACYPEVDESQILKALVDRERLGSTGIENGVAIPHAKIPGLDRIYAVFARSPEGIDFESVDGEASTLFFMLIAPDKKVGRHLAALERASRLLQNSETRRALLEMDASELFDSICRADEKG
ncbi:MAG: PTS sugar transporter subunit IIA [Candidatus Lernaella stagnicola]|nr:PTS sugar transporter subunit IIA [Candidatus Lernaella stagnicola]